MRFLARRQGPISHAHSSLEDRTHQPKRMYRYLRFKPIFSVYYSGRVNDRAIDGGKRLD